MRRTDSALHHVGLGGCVTWELEAIYGDDVVSELELAKLATVRRITTVRLTSLGRARLAELQQLAADHGEG